MAVMRNASARAAEVIARNNVQISGPDDAPLLVFAHGFGCDQTMYSRLLPYFEG